MGRRLPNFDLRLLTTSKEIGLRRLRSYAAALGGGAQIFHAYEDLQRTIELNPTDRRRTIVLHDGTLTLAAHQLENLSRQARVFVLDHPEIMRAPAPPTSSPSWHQEIYLRCTLATFLDAPVLRVSVAHLCRPDSAPFHLAHLLRWGHAALTWRREDQRELADTGLAFIKSLALVGSERRLTEMFGHFIATRLTGSGLSPEAVTFGSDGILTLVVARCARVPSGRLPEMAAELRVHDFPFAVLNRRADGIVEIGGLVHNHAAVDTDRKGIIVVINQQDLAKGVDFTAVQKAG